MYLEGFSTLKRENKREAENGGKLFRGQAGLFTKGYHRALTTSMGLFLWRGFRMFQFTSSFRALENGKVADNTDSPVDCSPAYNEKVSLGGNFWTNTKMASLRANKGN